MMNQKDDMNGNEPKYASLTAGLLARKGEAVPAAAAFTAEAIAQHIPARRLAQEAERVLRDSLPVAGRVIEDTSVAWRETSPEGRGAQVVSEHRDMIERAFDESVRADEGMPSSGRDHQADNFVADNFVEDTREQNQQQVVLEEGSSLIENRNLDLPIVGADAVSAPVIDDDLDRNHTLASLFEEAVETGGASEPDPVVDPKIDQAVEQAIEQVRLEMEDGSAVSDLDNSKQNWFESIVSRAISDAENHSYEAPGPGTASSEPLSPEPMLNGEALEPFMQDDGMQNERMQDTGMLTEGMQGNDMAGNWLEEGISQDALSVLDNASDAANAQASGSGCGDRANRVRDAIKTGRTGAASRSAMRLDPRRYIRLSLAAQKLQLSSQDVMLASLDTYLDTLDDEVFNDCACMKKGLI